MPNRVAPQEPQGEFNKIMLIGEAPGEQEELKGVPFVGMAGNILNGILEEVGIDRDKCYITNVYKYRPANNEFASIPREELAQGIAELQEEIFKAQPNVIVPLGEQALRAVTGARQITKWRGSILNTPKGKVIPTIHPAAIGREWRFRPLVVCDFKRIKEQSSCPEVRLAERELITHPTLNEVLGYVREVREHKVPVAFDIETETAQVCCIAFSHAPNYAMCVPFWFRASGSLWNAQDERSIWNAIKGMLEDESVPKIAQNAQYDMTILRDVYDIRVKGLWLDTMLAFHSVYPELDKGLDLLCSLYTDVPYYKYKVNTDSMDEFYEYNATDACVTFECAMKIYEEMKEFGVVEFYREHIHSLIQPLLDITAKGVKVDSKLKKEVTSEYKEIIQDLEAKLVSMVGHELNVNSPKQMQEWLYKELKLKPRTRLRKGKVEATVTADAEALEELYKETKHEAIRCILDIREYKKILSTYLEVEYDKQGGMERARTSYLISGTETGRLSSRETAYGTGTNMQNIPKGIVRRMFVPDEGKVFVNADLSQAEARVVAYLAGEDRLIKVFNNGGDIHRKNAANIFRKTPEEVTQEERELAKRIVHASNYGMGPITFSRNTGVTVARAKTLLNMYFSEYPRIKLWHMAIASRLKKSRTLVTPLGRKRTFFNRYDESLLKEAYAYIPQSTVADVLNMGLRRLHEKYNNTDTDILLQIHDAVLLQTPVEHVASVIQEVKSTLSIPIMVNSHELCIPVDISVGENWDSLQKR